jgi:hypothetical protein
MLRTVMHHGIPSLFSLCVDVLLSYIINIIYDNIILFSVFLHQFEPNDLPNNLYEGPELVYDRQSSPTSWDI